MVAVSLFLEILHMPDKTLPKVLVITGPTATGKTRIGVEIAKKLNGEIISADSRQVYKYMDIGTAKPTPEEREEVHHHLIDIAYPNETYSAGLFARDAKTSIEQILNRRKMPIIVGGTGLYLKALIHGIFEGPSASPQIRKRLNSEAEEYGVQRLYEKLQQVDPLAAAKISPKDKVRTIRALEIYEITGQPISHWRTHSTKGSNEYKFILFGISMDRKKLYGRINQRVDKMMEQGFLDEVKNLINLGYSFGLPALHTFGYLDMLNHLQGESTLENAIEKFKQGTRNYAKRQLTWFRHQLKLAWIDVERENPMETILTAYPRA